MPYITSTVAIAIMFSSLFSKDFGLINAALGAMTGIAPIDWLGKPEAIKPAIAFIVFWRFVGFNTVLYLAALQTIPKDLYEAATMDGASRWQQFLHITLPSLKPMIYFGVTLSVIGGLQLFEEPFILTGGKGGSGPIRHDLGRLPVPDGLRLQRLRRRQRDVLAAVRGGGFADLADQPRLRRPPGSRRMNSPSAMGRWGAYAIVGAGALFMLAPFYFMFVFATQSRTEIFNLPPPLFFGDALRANLEVLTTKLPFWRNVGWSLYVALASTALTLLFCSLAGYAFALLEFRYKKALFGAVMATMLLPSFMNMIPSFMIMDALGWIDEHRALYVPGAASAFGIFMMRQFAMSAVPRDLIEAARMDGCGEFGIYWRIVLPLMRPALGTLGLVTFIGSWNNFMAPLVVMRTADNYTLPLALRSLQSPVNTEWGALMAGSAIATLPLLVLFVLASRQLIAGLTAGAVK